MTQIPDSTARMTLTAYAARRGVQKMAVSRAVKKGTLSASVGRDEKGHPFIADPDLADREWAANVDYSKAPPEVKEKGEAARIRLAAAATGEAPKTPAPDPTNGDLSLTNASAREKHWKALTAELEYREKAGELVQASEVKSTVDAAFLRVRTKFLAVPNRMKQQRPNLTPADIGAFDALIRETLEDLTQTQAEDLA